MLFAVMEIIQTVMFIKVMVENSEANYFVTEMRNNSENSISLQC